MAKKKKLSFSIRLLFLLLFICLAGIFFVFEASVAESFSTYGHQYHYVFRQLQWFGVGIAAFLVGWLVPNKIWSKISPLMYFGSIVLMLLVFVPTLGVEINGARRWFVISGISIQPVEFFKVALILYFSQWLSRHQRLLPFLFSVLIPSIILLIQPDFGSLLVVLFIAAALFFIAGGSLRKIAPVAIAAVVALSLLVVTSPYRLRRVQTFLNPESDPLGASFQIRQITLALGSGGLFGRGLGNSQQKYAFIPEASSDSIFAIIAEEIGFIGSLLLISIYIYYLYNLYSISRQLPVGSFSQLVVVGLWVWIAGQALLNLSAIVALVPLTGLPLPFFSYGGSSLISLMFLNGIGYKLAREV